MHWTPFPVLFSFHGGAGYTDIWILFRLMIPDNLLQILQILLLYIHKQLLTPKEGQLLGFIRHQLITMVFFVEAIIDAMSLEYYRSKSCLCMFIQRVILYYELGCRLNSKIAAFAAVSGSMLDNYYRDDIYGWGYVHLFIQLA